MSSASAEVPIVAVHYEPGLLSEGGRRIVNVDIGSPSGIVLPASWSWSREKLLAEIQSSRLAFATFHQEAGRRVRGNKVGVVLVDGVYYIRTDGENIAHDNLGDLLEV